MGNTHEEIKDILGNISGGFKKNRGMVGCALLQELGADERDLAKAGKNILHL
jgi:hypothetical protein